ncbi:MAG: alanine racemase [Thermovirgaceae bacterium]|nr:alanine racemase [Thermovirgaceae bacterium]
MIGTPLFDLDTPALLIDLDSLDLNLLLMQEKANLAGVKMRPHTKTHRTPAIGKLQIAAGAKGITVAKLGEAEVMAAEGLDDIFIANEIVGSIKMERLRKLARSVRSLAVGVDHRDQVEALSSAMSGEPHLLDVMIDVDTGGARTGVAPGEATLDLARSVSAAPGLRLRGIFTHDGNSYGAGTLEGVREISRNSQLQLLETARLMRSADISVQEVSIGSTPSLLMGEIEQGVTEIRPGSYSFMDANMAQVVGTYARCAQTVLATVISRPTHERVVLDTGTKNLNEGVHEKGTVTSSAGHGRLKEHPVIFLEKIYEEHSSFDIPKGSGLEFPIGMKLEIIANHACQTTNFFDVIHGIRNGRVETVWPVLCRGKSQ